MGDDLGRALDVMRYLIGTLLRSPRRSSDVLRSLASTVLDFRFAETSPLPPLPGGLLDALGHREVALPPRNLVGPGNQSDQGLLWLVSLAGALAARTAFEIGTYNGLTALTLAGNLPNLVVHTLDLARDQDPALSLQRFDHISLKEPGRVFVGTPEEERIVQHLGDSARFDFSPFEGRCDLVYVDGAHSYEYVRNDTTAAFRMVSARGAIVWDDYTRHISDVPRFLHELERPYLYRLPDSRLVVWLSDGARDRLSRAGRSSSSPRSEAVG